MQDYLEAIHDFATDAEFRAQFKVDPAAALGCRGLQLCHEQLAALSEMASEDDVRPADAEGRISRWFQYGELTPSALGAR